MAKKTYKFRIYPTKRQTETLNFWLSSSCELYNGALQERRDAWKLNRVSINYNSQNKQLTEIKLIRDEFKTINSHVLQDALQRIDKTFKAFYSRVKKGTKAGFPRFRSVNRYDAFVVPNTRYSIENKVDGLKNCKLNLSRLGKIRLRQDCEIEGELKSLTVKREGTKWYACIGVDFEPSKLPVLTSQIGIDVGLKSFAVTSSGEIIENPRYFEKSAKKLRKVQRKLSRRKKFSGRWKKASALVRVVHKKIANQRKNFLHQVSYDLIRDNQLIAIEKLNVKGLASGMLAKSVNSASWGSFFDKLKYKAENAGREIIEVNPNGTSQTCLCGETVSKTLADRWHKCESCGVECDRDLMSAQVILQRALLI